MAFIGHLETEIPLRAIRVLTTLQGSLSGPIRQAKASSIH